VTLITNPRNASSLQQEIVSLRVLRSKTTVLGGALTSLWGWWEGVGVGGCV